MPKTSSPLFLLSCLLCACQSIVEEDARVSQITHKQEPTGIVISQIGYRPGWPKHAFLINSSQEHRYVEVFNNGEQQVILKIRPGRENFDQQSGDKIQLIDFSSVTVPGTYQLRFGELESYSFSIGREILYQPFVRLLRSYYLQRSGVAISDSISGIQRLAGHLEDGFVAHDDAYNKKGTRINSTGGWYDAGDYGKYIATTAVSAGNILSLFESHSLSLKDLNLSIPESSNDIPDVLDEVAVALDWMLTMQRQDGAVYRKLSGQAWPALITPVEDKQTRYIYGVSSPETAKAAAAWAMAARIYQAYLPEQAQRYLNAAHRAWDYLEQHPQQIFDYREKDDGGSGPYMGNETDFEKSLHYDWDDRLWVAAELYITTGEKVFQGYLKEKIPDAPLNLFEWKDPSALGMMHYLFHPSVDDAPGLQAHIKDKILLRADIILQNVAASAYRIANSRFIWGSNKMTAEEGVILLYAYQLSGELKYRDAAIDQLAYLFGRNHFNKSFVTGTGANPVANNSHIFVRASKQDIPGLLVGGPNELAQAGFAPKDKGPLSYIDDPRSYATNEYAIDYNASLIKLMGMLAHLGERPYTGISSSQTLVSK